MFNQLRTTKKIEKKIVLAENDVYLHINKRTFIDIFSLKNMRINFSNQ